MPQTQEAAGLRVKSSKAADVTQRLPDAERGAARHQLKEANGRDAALDASGGVIITITICQP